MTSTTTFAPSIYEFDPATQTEIVACMVFDDDFVRQTDGLIKADYFIDDLERFFVDLALNHHEKYQESPSLVAVVEGIREALKNKRLREDQKDVAREKIKELKGLKVRSREWLLDKIAEFAKQQAIANAMARSIPLLMKGGDPERFTKAEGFLSEAFKIGLHTADEDYSYFDHIEDRTKERLAVAAGGKPATGITTGVPELDNCLLHKGWGRKELSLFLGNAKASKSFLLTFCAGRAVQAGYNVLFVTLENSREIVSSRMDALMSGVGISEQYTAPHGMETGVKAEATKHGVGKLFIQEYPSGTFKPSDLNRLLDRFKTKGIKFDLVVVDYLDIAAPNIRSQNHLENSKSIFVDMRGIAQSEGFALLSATQANRSGANSAILRMDQVADDFSKIRTADLVLGLNRTEEERAEGKARITFVAARNNSDGSTLFITQDLDRGLGIKDVESVE